MVAHSSGIFSIKTETGEESDGKNCFTVSLKIEEVK